MSAPRTPVWLVPSAPGLLSNKRASNTTSDLITVQFRFAGTAASAVPGAIRVIGQRNSVAGVPAASPNYVWDTAWTPGFATTPFPALFSSIALGSQSAVEVNGRVYVLVPTTAPFGATSYAVATICSASVNGPNIGSWRFDPIQPVTGQAIGNREPAIDSCNPGALGYGGGYLYALGQKYIYCAQVLPDTTLGPWKIFQTTISGPGSTMCVWNVGSGAGIFIVYAGGGGSTSPTNTYIADSNGVQITNGAYAGIPTSRQYGACCVDGNGYAYFFGGEDNSGSPQANVYYATLNLATGALGSWNAGQSLPAGRTRFGYAYVYSPSAFWPNTNIVESAHHIVGGQLSSGGAALNTGITNTGGGVRAPSGWVNYSSGMSTAARSCAATFTGGGDTVFPATPNTPFPGYSFSPTTALGFETGVSTTTPFNYLAIIGGLTGAGGVTPNSVVEVTSGGLLAYSFWFGNCAAMTGAQLGNGGVVTANADGTYDVTFAIGGKDISGWGVPMGISTLVDGDLLQLTLQVSDGQSGDVATSLPTTIKIGQPPTISGLAVNSTATSQPLVSFKYSPGAGGAGQQTWQIKITRNSDSKVMFDTGVLNGTTNSVQTLIAPGLANGVAYTVTANVSSLDTPMPGAVDTATATLALTPSLAAAPGVPSSVSVTNSDANGWDQLNWTNAASTTSNRIYARRTGSGAAFQLIVDNYTAGSGAQSVKLMDQVPLGVAMDFCVSAVASNSESAQSSVVSTTLSPAAGGYSTFLHVAGQALTGATGVALLIDPANMQIQTKYSSKTIALFGRGQPTQRQGLLNYRELQLTHFSTSAANMSNLAKVVAASLSGSTLYYRDALGAMWTCAIQSPEDVKYNTPNWHEMTIRLTQVPNTFVPYVGTGSAIGVPTLVSGSVPPMDSSELVA